MTKKLFIPIMLFIMFSCSKERDNQTRELNISLKSIVSVADTAVVTRVTFYPNPFQDIVFIRISGSNNAQLLISDDNGDKKKISITSSLTALNFSEEKAGAYYFEILVNKTVYRTYLIKY